MGWVVVIRGARTRVRPRSVAAEPMDSPAPPTRTLVVANRTAALSFGGSVGP